MAAHVASIASAATDLLDCERATVFLYDASTNELHSRLATGIAGSPLSEIRFPASRGIAGEVARTGLHGAGREPRIAVAGLNPHAGEGGLFGREEIEVIAPAVAAMLGPDHAARIVADEAAQAHLGLAQRCFVGDVLFAGSIGRTDFPGGDHDTLIASITQRLWPMGDDTVFIPGHGPESTFGRERRTNPYVGGT